MHIKAIDICFLENCVMEVTFQDGKVFDYDISILFSKYPQLEELKRNNELFISGQIDKTGYGIVWNEELDIDVMKVYECGKLVGHKDVSINQKIGALLIKTREEKKITQTELAKMTNIDQGDISRIEKGLGNPTVSKLNKLFSALGKNIDLSLK